MSNERRNFLILPHPPVTDIALEAPPLEQEALRAMMARHGIRLPTAAELRALLQPFVPLGWDRRPNGGEDPIVFDFSPGGARLRTNHRLTLETGPKDSNPVLRHIVEPK